MSIPKVLNPLTLLNCFEPIDNTSTVLVKLFVKKKEFLQVVGKRQYRIGLLINLLQSRSFCEP